MISPRFFNLAVRNLGYTHTEAGFRTIAQLDAELSDMMELNANRPRTSCGMVTEDFGDDGEEEE